MDVSDLVKGLGVLFLAGISLLGRMLDTAELNGTVMTLDLFETRGAAVGKDELIQAECCYRGRFHNRRI